jgi:hypothetical protein
MTSYKVTVDDSILIRVLKYIVNGIITPTHNVKVVVEDGTAHHYKEVEHEWNIGRGMTNTLSTLPSNNNSYLTELDNSIIIIDACYQTSRSYIKLCNNLDLTYIIVDRHSWFNIRNFTCIVENDKHMNVFFKEDKCEDVKMIKFDALSLLEERIDRMEEKTTRLVNLINELIEALCKNGLITKADSQAIIID